MSYLSRLHNTTNAPLSAPQKAAYKARNAELHQPNDPDDIQEISSPGDAKKTEINPLDDATRKEISPPDDAIKSKTSGSLKRKRGRPRKIQQSKLAGDVKDDSATDATAGGVENRARRKSNPGPQKLSPYKEI